MDICLVAVPFMPLQRPSIGLSILKASLVNAGFDAEVIYTNIKFAERIGIENYWLISTYSNIDYLGEWIFSQTAFRDFYGDEAGYFDYAENILRETINNDELMAVYLNGQSMREYFTNLRSITTTFIDAMAENILAHHPRIVGCSSTLQEHCASLALLRRIHELNPDIITMIGGANCEAVMGQITHKNFLFVDYVVSGEAEMLLPELCRNILQLGREIPDSALPLGVLGPMSRFSMPVRNIGRAVVQDLNQSAIPDYSDYFAQLTDSSLKNYVDPALIIETSRGCWWGDKLRCSFCGLNSEESQFRSKTAPRVQLELISQTERYQISNYLTADNILNQRFFKDLIPSLGNTEAKYSFFFEIKANLTRKQVSLLKDAGIHCLQPGIESLHSELLNLLYKGVSARQNIELLKWTLEYRIDTCWYILTEIPGAREEWYAEMAKILPLIAHLQPPMGFSKICFSRFSPYHNEPSRFGLDLVPMPGYQRIFPMSTDDLADFAYYFIDLNEIGSKHRHSLAMQNLRANYAVWKTAWTANADKARTKLSMIIDETAITITDTRPCAIQQQITLTGLPKAIYSICDTAASLPKILDELSKTYGMDIATTQLEHELEALLKLKTMMHIDGRYLSLAVREHENLSYAPYPGGTIDGAKIHWKFFLNRLKAKET
ncbi:MAG: RiPP maturation radical SAM protein 1 [Methylococcaceae bacterium]|nr:MAG: RiPP maturation radical SAM protein 1 [Methylococcaceae bacterium]